MGFFEEKIAGRTVFKGRILQLDVDKVRLDDGSVAERECVRHSGGAAVLLIKDGKILLVKQFRYLYGKEIYEIPAGKLNGGEEPMAGAKRELEEETGYIGGELVPLLKIYPSVGYTDEVIHVFEAKGCRPDLRKPDEGEFLDVKLIDLNVALKMIDEGEICDAKTVAAIYKYCLKNGIEI